MLCLQEMGHLANKCQFKYLMKRNNVKNVEQGKEVSDHHEEQEQVVLGSIMKISE